MGEFSFPRLVVFCLLPVTYKRDLERAASICIFSARRCLQQLETSLGRSLLLFFLFAGFLDYWVLQRGKRRRKRKTQQRSILLPVGYPRRRLSAVTPSFLSFPFLLLTP